MIILLCLNIFSDSSTERKLTDLDCYQHTSIDYWYCKFIQVETVCSSWKFPLQFNRIIHCLQCFPVRSLLWSKVMFLKSSSAFENNLCKSEQGFREASKPEMRLNYNSGEVAYALCPCNLTLNWPVWKMRHLRTYSYDVGSAPLPNLFSLPLGRVNESQLIVCYHCLISPVKLSLFEKARQQQMLVWVHSGGLRIR